MALEQNVIHQGDCVQLLQQLDPGSIDLVFADPPFNIGYEYDVYDDVKASEDYLSWCRSWIEGIYRALKANGTFWLAIGDEYAAELKIEAQRAGFHCRSWVIWYYTFGVNCVNGFSRSHTHLFHFVKDKSNFTFNRLNPQIRIKSARQLVYADNRANPNGRLPDNTWIIRPQDAPLSFSPAHDTWYFARVAGTFKEREGFHGCQMPEQLLARIIRASSLPCDTVLDPFGGSGTTMCVAKKLGRRWIGFELSSEYVKYIKDRIDKTDVGEKIDGPEDPIESAPSTFQGKQRRTQKDSDTERGVIESYLTAGAGFPADIVLCDRELNGAFIAECKKRGIDGNPYFWNRLMLQLRKSKGLPKSSRSIPEIKAEQLDQFGYASEVAWRLLAIDFRKTLDDILCSPDFAEEFDRLATRYSPKESKPSSLRYRQAALSIRKRSTAARRLAASEFRTWLNKSKSIPMTPIHGSLSHMEQPGVFVLYQGEIGFYVGESLNVRERLECFTANPAWRELNTTGVGFIPHNENLVSAYGLKSAIAMRENALLNCRLLISDREL